MDSISAVPAVTSASSTSNTYDAYSQMMKEEWAQFQVLMDLVELIKLLFGNLKGMEKGKKQVKVNNSLSDIHYRLSDSPSAFSSPATKDLNKLLGSKTITLDMLVNCLLDVLYQNDP